MSQNIPLFAPKLKKKTQVTILNIFLKVKKKKKKKKKKKRKHNNHS